jgi:hypothetical protein
MINCCQFCFNFAFKFNLRRYIKAEKEKEAEDTSVGQCSSTLSNRR